MIENPILRGAYLDPSFLRVGDDHYIANCTFEWFPGVLIHHSRDLKNWRLVGHALTRTSQLEMRGIVESGGVWALSMSYGDGKFWLIYTIVRTRVGNYKDVNCCLTNAARRDQALRRLRQRPPFHRHVCRLVRTGPQRREGSR